MRKEQGLRMFFALAFSLLIEPGELDLKMANSQIDEFFGRCLKEPLHRW